MIASVSHYFETEESPHDMADNFGAGGAGGGIWHLPFGRALSGVTDSVRILEQELFLGKILAFLPSQYAQSKRHIAAASPAPERLT